MDFDIATGPGQAACSGYGPGQCYVPVREDVGHALRVEVTAVNEEGSATASSQASIPISSHDGPRYQYGATGWPQIVGSWKVGGMGRKGGSGRVGEKLWAGTGLWRNPTSLTSARVQWQRCAADPNARHFDPGRDCRNIAGAVTTCGRACLRYSAGVPFFGRGHSVQELKIHGVPSYRVRAADVGHRLRLLLTVLGPNGGTGYSVSLPSTLVR